MGGVGGVESSQGVVSVRVEEEQQGAGRRKQQRWQGLPGEAAKETRLEAVAVVEEDIVVGTFSGKAGEFNRDKPRTEKCRLMVVCSLTCGHSEA